MKQHNRNVVSLAACQGLLIMNNVMMISIGTLAAYTLAGNKLLITLPATAYVVGGALATLPMSHYMRRSGRRAGFIIGCGFGLAGGALAAVATAHGSFWLLCLAELISGVYTGTGGFYRFAAAETAEPRFRSRAISLVLAGGILGGIFGPESSKITKDLLDTVFVGSFLSLVALAAIAMWIASRLQIPMPSAEERGGATRSIREIARQPVFIVALLGAVTAYGVMNLLMAAAPLAMQLCGHPYNAQILVIEGHLVAMFAPAFFTGWLIARVGTLPVMFTGVVCKIAAVAAAVTGLTVFNFWIAMVLIGVGWCFLFIGGTTLLTEAYRPAEKAKSQGTNDLLVFLTMASSSFASGAILHRFGWTPLNLSALPLLAITGVSIAWLAALRRVAAARALPAAAE